MTHAQSVGRSERTAPVPLLAVRISEAFLDELVRRTHAAENFPSTVEMRFDVPTMGVAGAVLRITLAETRLELSSRDRNRPRLEVRMDGRVDWEFLLGRVTQTFDLRYDILPDTEFLFVDAEHVELRSDFARAQIDKVRTVIRETSYLPPGIQQELLGPLGRRFLDGFSGEAIRMLMRRLGRRSAPLGPPLGRWLDVLGIEPGPADVVVGSRWLDVSWQHPETRPDDAALARSLDHRFEGADIGVTVAAERAPELLDHWAAEFQERTDVAFRDAHFRIDDDGEITVAANATIKLPGPLPSPATGVDLRLDPGVHDGVLYLEPQVRDFSLPSGWGWLGRAFRGSINRGLARRMRFEVIWQIPVPLGDGDWWQLSMDSLEISGDAVRVRLDTWFPTP